MLNDNVRDNLLVSLQFNLARSEELHAALKQEGCVTLMTKVLAQAPQSDGAQHEVRGRGEGGGAQAGFSPDQRAHLPSGLAKMLQPV
jgi:hypothetical protein